MKVFIVMEYRSSDEEYNWGVFSTEDKANDFLKSQGWYGHEDFKIEVVEVDKPLL